MVPGGGTDHRPFDAAWAAGSIIALGGGTGSSHHHGSWQQHPLWTWTWLWAAAHITVICEAFSGSAGHARQHRSRLQQALGLGMSPGGRWVSQITMAPSGSMANAHQHGLRWWPRPRLIEDITFKAHFMLVSRKFLEGHFETVSNKMFKRRNDYKKV